MFGAGFPIVASHSGPAIVVPGGVCLETPKALNGGSIVPWRRLPLLISGFFKFKTTHFVIDGIALAYNSHTAILSTETL